MENTRAAAKAAGEKFYVGAPCKHGHEGVRWVSSRQCVECNRLIVRERYREHKTDGARVTAYKERPKSGARALAKAAGEKFYQGAPCEHGHDGKRYVSNKLCVECGRERALAQSEAGEDRHNEARRENAFLAEWYPDEFDRKGWRHVATREWDAELWEKHWG